GFFAGGLAARLAAGLDLGAFLAGGFLDFFAGTFLAALAAGFLPAAFLAILRVRAEILWGQETRFSMASWTAPPARSLVELSAERGPSSTTRDGAEPRCRDGPSRRARGARREARTVPG